MPASGRLCATLCAAASLWAATASAATCSTTLTSKAAPVVANGYSARLVATNLTRPRSLLFDSAGNLLVVQSGKGIASLSLRDDGGTCVTVAGSPQDVVLDRSLNHGLELSADGKTLYASSSDAVFSWDYDATAAKRTTSDPVTLVSGMANTDHTTRTLLLSRKNPGMIIVSRGSTENVDPLALDINSGHSQIKAFNLTARNGTTYDFVRNGALLGWGLRNSVGVAEDPTAGGIWSVENSVDNMDRDGTDVHQDNPGEELNFHGYLNGTQDARQGSNYGYPNCYAAWDTSEIPRAQSLGTGTQFSIGAQNATNNDDICKNNFTAPIITFPAHTAPLDIKFNTQGTAAWVTFHGSWNRNPPIGYKLSYVEYRNGWPTASATSKTAAIDVITHKDLSKCPGECVRPVGLAWDSKGRLFMSSDTTGEIWVITRNDGGSVNTATQPSQTGSGSPATSSQASAAAPALEGSSFAKIGAVAALAVGAVQLLL